MPTVRLELSIGLEARRLSSLHKKTCPAAGYGAGWWKKTGFCDSNTVFMTVW